MHIMEQVGAALIADGWSGGGQGHAFNKVIVGWAGGGVMVPDGRRRVYLRIDDAGRWLERVDGWNNVQKDVDLRNFPDNPAAAIAAVMEKKA